MEKYPLPKCSNPTEWKKHSIPTVHCTQLWKKNTTWNKFVLFCNSWSVLRTNWCVYNFTLGIQATWRIYRAILARTFQCPGIRHCIWNIDRFFEPDNATDYSRDLVMGNIEQYLHNKDICLMHRRYEGLEKQRVLEIIVFRSLHCGSLECI